MKKIFLILFVLLIAGCTGTTNSGSNPNQGIIIDSLTISPNDITEKEPFDLFFKVSNVGENTTEVTPYLYGADWIESDFETRELMAANDQTGAIGESFIYQKTFDKFEELNNVAKGLVEEPTITGRICYSYMTTAATTVEVLSLTEKRIKDVKQASKTVKTDNTDAPIHLEFTIREPIIHYDEDESNEITIALKAKDVGGGFATNDDCDESNPNPTLESMNKITVSLTGNGIDDCEDEIVHLVNGQATLFCKLDAITKNLPSRDIHITAEATYTYYKTKTVKMKVSGVS